MKTGFIAIFIAALLIRLSFLGIWMHFSHNSWKGGSFEWGGEMGSIAVNLFEGRGFSSPFFPGSAPTAWLSPAVPFLWSVVMRLQGEATRATAKLLIFLQAIPSALAVSLYWLIAKEIRFKHMVLSAQFPTVIAAMLAFWPDSLFRLGELWYFVWEDCAVAALVLLGMKWLQRQTWSNAVWLGLVGGTLALINIAPVPFLVCVILLPALTGQGEKREFVKTLLAFLIMLAIVSPWLVRCRLRLGGFVPLRSNAGTELLQGNNAIDCIRETEESLHPVNSRYEMQRFNTLGELQYNRVPFREALTYIREHNLQTAIRILQRIYVGWFTDILDFWPYYKEQKWWNGGLLGVFSPLTTIITALSTLSLATFAIASRRLEGLPFRWLLFALLLLMPMLHYITVMEDSYTYVNRIWLAIIGMFAIFNSPKLRLKAFPDSA